MNLFNNIKDLLGFPKSESSSSSGGPSNSRGTQQNQLFNSTPDEFSGNHHKDEGICYPDQSPKQFIPRGFSVFSDTLEMHKFFEHQMTEILKSFGFHHFDEGNSFFHSFSNPPVDGPFTEDGQSPRDGDIRNQYLKPGYEKPTLGSIDDKTDRDVDGKLNVGDLDSIFGGHDKHIIPHENRPSIRTFGQSITTKTVRHSDGSTETHHTVRDNEGNEETTITKRLGDKEYTITKRRNKHGEEESIENLVNIEENELDKTFNKPHNEHQFDTDMRPPNWFPFDKFFTSTF